MEIVKQVIKEIGAKTREFYEFVLPPVDMYLNDDSLKVVIDIPGFEKKDIRLTLCENILSIKAAKTSDGGGDGKQKKEEEEKDKTKSLVINQRPSIIDKKIRLPIEIKQGEEEIESAKLKDGVLTLTIPIQKTGKDISIE